MSVVLWLRPPAAPSLCELCVYFDVNHLNAESAETQRERKCAQCARILIVCSAEDRRDEEQKDPAAASYLSS